MLVLILVVMIDVRSGLLCCESILPVYVELEANLSHLIDLCGKLLCTGAIMALLAVRAKAALAKEIVLAASLAVHDTLKDLMTSSAWVKVASSV